MSSKSVLGRDPFSSFTSAPRTPALKPGTTPPPANEPVAAQPPPRHAKEGAESRERRGAPPASPRVRALVIETGEPRARKLKTAVRKPARSAASAPTADAYGRLERRLERALGDAPRTQQRDVERTLRVVRDRPERGESNQAAGRVEEIDRRIEDLLSAAKRGLSGAARPEGISDEALQQVSLVRRLIELLNGARELAGLGALKSLWREAAAPPETGDDPSGIDRVFAARLEPILEFLYDTYWRVEVEGLEHVPTSKRALLVANHAGLLPYDGLMIDRAVRTHHPAHREVRFLVDDTAYHFPVIGPIVARLGGVRASAENTERLLRQDQLACVFPEGIKGMTKRYRSRYQLQRFGRGGFVTTALRTRSPIVPTAVIGSEEIHPIVARLDWLGRLVGLPITPVTPTLPLLGPLGLIPLPSKWRIRFSAPISVERYDPEDASDYLIVSRVRDEVRATVQQLIDEGRDRHPRRFFG